MLEVLFDEQVTGIASGWRLVGPGDTLVAGAITVAPSLQRATFTPSVQLAAQTSYTVQLDQTVADVAGNALAGAPLAWTFVTGADAAPVPTAP